MKTDLPILPSKLQHSTYKKIAKFENQNKLKQASYYNRRHNVKLLSKLKTNDCVFIFDLKKYGFIESISEFPRSYIVNVNGKKYRRNRTFLNHVKENKKQNNVSLPTKYSSNNFDMNLFEENLSPNTNAVNTQSNENDKYNSNISNYSLVTPYNDEHINSDIFVSPCNNSTEINTDFENFASPYNSNSKTVNSNENNSIKGRPKRNVKLPKRLLDYEIQID